MVKQKSTISVMEISLGRSSKRFEAKETIRNLKPDRQTLLSEKQKEKIIKKKMNRGSETYVMPSNRNACHKSHRRRGEIKGVR